MLTTRAGPRPADCDGACDDNCDGSCDGLAGLFRLAPGLNDSRRERPLGAALSQDAGLAGAIWDAATRAIAMNAPFWGTAAGSLGLLELTRRARRVPYALRPSAAPSMSRRERGGFHMEALSFEEMDADQQAWADLLARALEPNGFFEPAFALSAARHFPIKARPRFVAVWESGSSSAGRRLMGLFPLTTPGAITGAGFAQVWLHKQATLATPLLDKDRAVDVARVFFDWIENSTSLPGVLFPRLPKDGPVYAALAAAASEGGRRVEIIEEFRRAVLLAGGDADELWTRGASRKELKELRRRQRRLEEKGAVEIACYSSPEEVRRAAEDFIALEASGWKAGKGAFLSHPSLTTFMRSATRLLAREGKCQIYALNLNGRPIATGVVVTSLGRSLFWKIAFDEALRSQAPGIQLLYAITAAQLKRPDIDMTDSCAIADHPMIERFWPDRLSICDMAVQARADGKEAFLDCCRREKARRRLKSLAKQAAARLLNRRVS